MSTNPQKKRYIQNIYLWNNSRWASHIYSLLYSMSKIKMHCMTICKIW